MNLRAAVAVLAVSLVAPASADAPTSGSVVRVDHRDPHALPSRGPTNALVTIELFYTPWSSSRHQAVKHLERLQANHPTRIRLIYRLVKGATARFHYAALHAYGEGRFVEFMDAINGAPRPLDDKALLDLGKRVGLDPERLSAAITRPPAAYDALLDSNERRRRQKFRSNPSLPNVVFNGRPPAMSLSQASMQDLEREYQAAKDLAEELLDQGVSRSELPRAFDQIVQLPEEIVIVPGPTDEDDGSDDLSMEPQLARPPLAYTSLPSHGLAETAVTIAVLCSPTSNNCNAPLQTAQKIADRFPDDVRVVWGPYFDVTREDAADMSVLADAALCAERDGGRAIDREDNWDPRDSPGWRWVREVLAHAHSRTLKRWTTDQLIDRVADRLRVESRAFATCRAELAGTSIAWIERARRAGVRSTPTTVVNGRIYGPINDENQLQLLVEAELAPGILAPSWMRRAPK